MSNYYQLNLSIKNYHNQLNRNLVGQRIGQYKIKKQIGHKGKDRISRVYQAINTMTEKRVAIKTIDIDRMVSQDKDKDQSYLEFLRKQSDLMMEGHKNILKCHEVYQNKFLKLMVLDYCQSNLQEQIKIGAFKKDYDIFAAAEQIISGVNVLHTRNILHRDLKFRGILYHRGHYFLSDIGIDNDAIKDKQFHQNKIYGFPLTMPKEVKEYQNNRFKRITILSDIWSLGPLVFFMKYKQRENSSFQSQMMNEQYFSSLYQCIFDNRSYFSQSLSSFIKLMMTERVELRPSCSLLLRELQKNRKSRYSKAFISLISHRQSTFKEPGGLLNNLRSFFKGQNQEKIFLQNCHLFAKASYICNRLLIQAMQEEIFDLNHQKTKQFLFLLATRCKNDYQPLIAFAQRKNTVKKPFRIISYKEDNSRIDCKLREINKYQLQEESIFNKFKSFFSRELAQQSMMLQKQGTKQGRDYPREEQIKFLLSLVPEVIDNLKSVPQKTQNVRMLLNYLEKLFNLQAKERETVTVEDYVNNHLYEEPFIGQKYD